MRVPCAGFRPNYRAGIERTGIELAVAVVELQQRQAACRTTTRLYAAFDSRARDLAKLLPDAMSPLEPTNVVYEIRVQGRRLVRTTQLADAQWAVRAAAEAGEGAKIVNAATGQVIERHPPRRN